MLVTSTDDPGLEYLLEAPAELRRGDRVRVTEGVFKAEGYIRRVKGNRRLIVSIEGVVAVATTYIPGCFLKNDGLNRFTRLGLPEISAVRFYHPLY